MGICYYNLQNYDNAISEMEQALKIRSQTSDWLFRLRNRKFGSWKNG